MGLGSGADLEKIWGGKKIFFGQNFFIAENAFLEPSVTESEEGNLN